MLDRLWLLSFLALALPAGLATPATLAADTPATTQSAATQPASPALRLAELREQAETTRDLLREINERLETMTERVYNAPDDAARSRENESAVMLNGLKSRYQFRLDELRREIRDAEHQQTADIFAGDVDVFMSAEELNRSSPSINNVTFKDTVELAGKTYVRLKAGSYTFTVDPQRIVAVRSRVREKR